MRVDGIAIRAASRLRVVLDAMTDERDEGADVETALATLARDGA